MQALSTNDVGSGFGEMLSTIEDEPIQIEQNGKPVAVVLSMEDYQQMEDLKLAMLKQRVANARKDIENGDTVDGETYFKQVIEAL